MTRPLVEKVYPSPSPPKGSKEQFLAGAKEDFTKIRQAARKAPQECLDSFDTLRDYLQQEGVTTELGKVRFFFEWLLINHAVPVTSATAQKVASSPVQLTSCFVQGCKSRPTAEEPVSPGEWLGRCQSDFQMYTDFFTVLCRNSGVGCVIIQGYVKGAGFEGEKASRWNCPRGRWVAVNLTGEWRFINPHWAFVSDQQAGDDDTAGQFALVVRDRKDAQIEDQSAINTRKDKKWLPEKTVKTTEENPEEFWFLTDPAAFNAFCHAEDKKWQLLDSYGLWTDSEFLQKPKYTEEYFKSSKWHLLLEESGVLKAEKGQCIISYAYPVSAKTAYLKYNLYLKSQPSTSPKDLPDFNRHVVQEYRDKGQVRIVSLITRLPQYGLYKIEIAGVLDGDLQPLNEFVINVVNVPKKPEPFQEICQDVGVLPEARALGVVAEEEKGIVLVKPERLRSLRFTSKLAKLAKLSDTTLSAFLTHSYKKDEDLQKFVEMETTKDEVNKKTQTEMKVCLPQDKSVPFEYCLTIRVGSIIVARYILTGDKILTFPKENAIIDIKREILSAITRSDSENAKMLSKKYKSKIGPNIRNMIINLPPLPPPDPVSEDVEDVVESDELRAVQALRAALKNNNNETHLADLESALATAIRLGIKRGDYDNVMQVAESALIKLYEVELQRAIREHTTRALEDAIQHAKDSCIADQVKRTEPYGKAVILLNALIFKNHIK